MKSRITIEIGGTYNKLKVLREASPYYYKCLCSCGKEALVRKDRLYRGETKSCGCYRKEVNSRVTHKVRHGMTNTPTWNSWMDMKARCLNPNKKSYKDYGAKGISICERWIIFENFLEDMGERPLGTTLDRFPNNRGNYEPGNCRWATRLEQNRNQTVNKLTLEKARSIKVDNRPIQVIAEEYGTTYQMIWQIKKSITWKDA